jgi:hypothetical protein
VPLMSCSTWSETSFSEYQSVKSDFETALVANCQSLKAPGIVAHRRTAQPSSNMNASNPSSA